MKNSVILDDRSRNLIIKYQTAVLKTDLTPQRMWHSRLKTHDLGNILSSQNYSTLRLCRLLPLQLHLALLPKDIILFCTVKQSMCVLSGSASCP